MAAGEAIGCSQCLAPFDGPTLYCSAVNLVGEDLTLIRVHRRCVRRPSFENALVENIATGCTIVLNRPRSTCWRPASPRIPHARRLVLPGGFGLWLCHLRPDTTGAIPASWSNAMGVGQTYWAEWSGRVRDS